jgi:nucleoside-diphosphate-sugar epimerase
LPTKETEAISDLRSPYAVQKYASELFCRQFSEFFGLDTVCLRYFNAYGEGQYGDSPYCTVVAAWLESMYFPKNKKGFIEGTGTNSRDLVHVADVVQANILAMQAKKDLKGEVFNIASGKSIAVKDIRKLIEVYTGKKLSLEKRPSRPKDVRRTLADISKAKKVLGYRPRVSFSEGLKDTISFFEKRTR